jgi:uracil-DNA glycosylase
MEVKIEKSWKKRLQTEFDKPYFEKLVAFIKEEYQTKTIFPPASQIFNAFDNCPFDDVKIVIIGQDPYHGVSQAHGLCFSVNGGVELPPSLVNIFKEIERSMGKPIPKLGNLQRWAEQGVLLLNATLTVQAHQAGSHQGRGWETFTDAVIQLVSRERENVIFMLWGNYAQQKKVFIDAAKHKILTSVHPSPLSAYRGFIGNNHFQLANDYLEEMGMKKIDW